MTEKILIIEDSIAEAHALAYQLMEDYSFPSEIAHNLKEAESLLSCDSRPPYICAIVDLHLPDAEPGAAFTLTNQYKIPAIVFTGQLNPQLRERFTSDYLADFVFKSGEHDFKYVCWLVNRLYHNRNLKVLIVDDSISARLTLKTLVSHQGFQVFEADDGKTALDQMKHNPDIVIIDLFLPDILGYELSRKIHRDFKSDYRQLIGVSSKSDENSSLLLLKNGCHDFIPRPFNFEEFIYRLNQRAEYINNTQELHRLSEEKNRFLGMTAHDLRTPTSAIGHAANRLASLNLTDEKAIRAIEIINRSCDSMQLLLNDLLDISAIETGKLVLTKETCNLCLTVQERVQHHQYHAAEKDIGFNLDLPESAMVEVDATRITQVMDNLISNALKYSPKSSEISMQLSKDQHHVQFSIIDQGPGIREEDIDHLFTAFTRFGHQATGGESSHGLGLSICLKIMRAHGGSIAYEDADGGGSHFYIKIPK